MEPQCLGLYIAIFSISTYFMYRFLFKSRTKSPLNLPPSPPQSRLFTGHLHILENPIHKTLYKLSLRHGPIISLRLGSRLAVVVSSPSAAEECFGTKNDANFANRPHLTLNRHLGYNFTALVSTNYGEHWRNLRRICSLDIFSPGRLAAFLPVREGEAKQLVESLYRISTDGFTSIELRSKIRELTFNNITLMVAGKKFYGDVAAEDKEKAKEFQELISDAFKYSGASNGGDFLPILRWIDYKGIEKNMSIVSKKMDVFLQGLVNERRRLLSGHGDDNNKNSGKNMIDHLLGLQKQQPESFTDDIIKGLVLNMLIGGTNTSETTIEWAMSLLLNHPKVLKNARDEIDALVGFDRLVMEKDLSKLQYLKNVVLETFRLFPPLPLLVPHESSRDCKLGGYDVPGGTIIFANAWAIHRDPKVWVEPDVFNPERFKSGAEGVEAHKLLPFGMGRRVCPGAGMGQRVVTLALGSLIHSFEWKSVDGGKVDLVEGSGLTIPKANPLVVMCKPRQEMDKTLSSLI